ncbi:MAG: pyrophosphate--fructose-6-phosphate 1-phosphotransferase [Pseudomonadota bacterium]|nr:pyrophosphate--fructose-6-phosphate 1-phosphotransferase [Pseudomonadota bacterium]
MTKHKVAMLTAGGLAPCLSSSVAELITGYTRLDRDIPMIGYVGGYAGLLRGASVEVTPAVRERAHILHGHGGSPLGNSRVKLSNVADCVKRGLVGEGCEPFRVAAEQLARDEVTILHTIGGDDTSTTAAELARYLAENGYKLTVVGLPKTVDNDIVPVRQSLGALTAADQGAAFFGNFGHERTAAHRTLLVHEVMGRDSGWLTAATARAYRERLRGAEFLPEFNLPQAYLALDAVYVPESPFDVAAEGERLAAVMADKGAVSVFVSEGANAGRIVEEMVANGEEVVRDAFGHVALDKVNVGAWLGRRLAKLVGAERTLVQKSGYFARSAPANAKDRELIAVMAQKACESALAGISGLVGHDMARGDELRVIELERIAGGKRFDPGERWFREMLEEMGQPQP